MTSKLDDNILEIALQSLSAGESLGEIPESRALGAVPYKYGMHLGNRTDGGTEGLKREVAKTLPVSLTFLDNVKGDQLEELLVILKNNGVKPYVIFRPYFIPSGGANAANVEGYAQGTATRMKEDYLRLHSNGQFVHANIGQAYNEGRFIVKLFNETNIGGEGFARGRAGFADALKYWKQARSVVKGHFAKTKFISICNTPGNDDVYFTGDAQDQPYWFHGREAAKQTPTQAEIQTAIQTCPFREMFELCDFIGTHVYANIAKTVDGDLQTWYSRRHERSLVFLAPYIAQGKKMIINEWDAGYDDGQEVRAQKVVWCLTNVIGTNDAVLFVNHWWNSDDGEGAETWEKHQTRKNREFRPVVNAVADFRNGTAPPDPEPPVPVPPDTSINLPDWTTVHRVSVPAGSQYWKLKKAWWQDDTQSGGTHAIYVEQPHDPTKYFNTNNGQQNWNTPLDKPANEPAGNFPMFGGNVYTARMSGFPSDSVSGLKMPSNHHVSYFLTYELATQPIVVPLPQVQVALAGDAAQVLELNPKAAIQKEIFRKGYVPTSPEYPIKIEWEGQLQVPFVFQRAERLDTGDVRYFGCKVGVWNVVYWTDGDLPIVVVS